jgi:hypothetical protein
MAEYPPRPTGTEAEAFRNRRRGRNLAIMLVVFGLSALFFAITIVKMVQH